MKKILLIGAMVGMLGFGSQANAGLHISVGVGGPFYGPSPYYYGCPGPTVYYYGPGYYPWFNGYWHGGYYRGRHSYHGNAYSHH